MDLFRFCFHMIFGTFYVFHIPFAYQPVFMDEEKFRPNLRTRTLRITFFNTSSLPVHSQTGSLSCFTVIVNALTTIYTKDSFLLLLLLLW